MQNHVDVAIIGAGSAGLSALRQVRKVTDNVLLIDPGPLGTTWSRAQVPNIEDALFLKIAENAKNNCPVSKALANVEIHLSAELNP